MSCCVVVFGAGGRRGRPSPQSICVTSGRFAFSDAEATARRIELSLVARCDLQSHPCHLPTSGRPRLPRGLGSSGCRGRQPRHCCSRWTLTRTTPTLCVQYFARGNQASSLSSSTRKCRRRSRSASTIGRGAHTFGVEVPTTTAARSCHMPSCCRGSATRSCQLC